VVARRQHRPLLLRLDGSGERRLTTDPAHDEWPSFSPDGGSILFQRSNGSGESQVLLMARDGSGVRRVR
jgi:Tol biopolymer transport system component